ncbi:MAG: FAD-binding protein [Pseudonocardiales bacterium]|nr:FAD-binding protein [Pseudonocardiales bacterium]
MTSDVVIVGAGPAGLSAATVIAENDRSVVVIDEQPRPGGQYYRQQSAAVIATHGVHRAEGAALIERARRAGVQFRSGVSVWGVDDDRRTLLVSAADGTSIRRHLAPRIVVATGATERALPFPGWQLPAVTTVGYAQHLCAEGVRVGARVLVAGSGPFLLSVACSLVGVGVDVVAVLEEGTPYRPRAAGWKVAGHPQRLREFAAYRARLAAARVPVRSGRRVVSAEETADGLRVVEGPTVGTGRARQHTVDALNVGFGFRPQIDLLRLLGCGTRIDALSGDEVAVVDVDGATDLDGVWAAGEVTGIAGAPSALAEGLVVGAAVLRSLGAPLPEGLAAARRDVSRARAFASTLGRLYPAPRDLAALAAASLGDDALVCRCESVSAGQVRAAQFGGTDLQAVKAATRAGMGLCQGRECAPAVSALCGSPTAAFTVRPPLRPILLAAVAEHAAQVI